MVHNDDCDFVGTLTLPPPPPIECMKGRMRVPISIGKGGAFWERAQVPPDFIGVYTEILLIKAAKYYHL